MKKRLLLSLLCFGFMLLSACQREAAVQYYLCSDLFKCCEPKFTASQTQYRFYTYLVTPEPELEVEVVEVKGQNVDQCKVEFQGVDDETTAYARHSVLPERTSPCKLFWRCCCSR